MSSKSIDHLRVWGATTLRIIVTVPSKLVYSILVVDSVSLLRFSEKSYSGSSDSGITFLLNSRVLSSWYGSSVTGSSYLTGLAPILNNYRYLMVVNNLWFLLQEMGLG